MTESITNMPKARYNTPLLNKKEVTHGDYSEASEISVQLKNVIQNAVFRRAKRGAPNLTSRQRESLDMICTKMARIIAGDPSAAEHWEDIVGYANLILEA